MKIVAIIQARMGSTRLPGKVLRDIGGMTMLARVVRRVQRATLLHEVVVATSMEASDTAIVQECHHLSVPVFQGNEQDVLDRYYQAAIMYQAAGVIRITADCPLIEAEVIDKVVAAFKAQPADYASNIIERTYPRGLDTEVMTLGALEQVWRSATEPYQRIHVTPYFYQHPEQFRLLSITSDADYSHYRWTVDTAEDLTFIQAVYAHFGGLDNFSWREVLRLMHYHPELLHLNEAIQQKALHEG